MSICLVIAQYAGHLFFGLGVVTVQRVQVDQRDLRKSTARDSVASAPMIWVGLVCSIMSFGLSLRQAVTGLRPGQE